MEAQRLRNLTTGKLHTEMDHIYQDLEAITGQPGLMTHMLPRALDAVKPWLLEHVADPRYWNGMHDPDHSGEFALPESTEEDRAKMLELYQDMPDPLEGKQVLAVKA